jgi:hypothetical protein
LPNPAADLPTPIEVDWQAASAVGTNDGYVSLWVDGVLKQTLASIDNPLRFAARAGEESCREGARRACADRATRRADLEGVLLRRSAARRHARVDWRE